MRPLPRTAAPYALFFLSGASGLVYEVVWVRQFGNVFGNTIHSAALVTAVFMCGLGAGSYLAGVWADRRRGEGLLAAYGGSEVLIGALGIALAGILPRLGALSASISSYARDEHGWFEVSALSQIGRCAIAALLLAPMTLLMGATLTLLIRHLVRDDLGRAGVRIGALYGLNTAGAALGCFLTDFALVPRLGLWGTQIASATLNVAVGVAALALAARAARSAVPAPEPPPAPEGGAPPEEGARHAVALTAAALALTGFAGMGMEMVWLRFIIGAMGQHRAVFSILLTVILLGIWAGAMIGGAVHRRWGKPASSYIVIEVLFVVATLGLLATFDRSAVDFRLMEAFRAAGSPESGLSPAAQGWVMIRAVAALVGLPSLLMGCSFPLANANVQRVEARVGRRAGALYLANTAGSVVGSLAAGFVLLPMLGAQQSVFVLALAAGAAIVPLHLSTRASLGGDRAAGAEDYVFAGGFLSLLVVLASWSMLLPSHYLRTRSLPEPLGQRYLTVSEGPSELLAVSVGPDGSRRLWTNGHSMSTTGFKAQRYMRAFAHLPLLSMEAPARALVICFGVGNTVNAVSLHPSVAHIELADLSRNVLSHGSFFAATNGDVLRDPRLEVFVDDGRQHLRTAPPGAYDLVTLEPPPLAHAGVSALYSKEFYELVRSRLAPGGFATQWLPVEQLQGPESLAVVRAFVDVFPASVLLSGERHDLILMGTTGPSLEIDPAAVERRLRERPRVAEDLERVDLSRITEIVGTFAAGADTLRRATANTRPVTDDAPSMEYSVMSKLFSSRIPAEIFDVGGVASFCPSCRAGAEPAPGLEDLDAYLHVLGRLYASDAFLIYRSFSPTPVELDLPELLEGDGGAISGAILRSRYLQRVVGIDPHGLPMSLRAPQLAALQAFIARHPGEPVAALRLGLGELAAGRNPEAEAALRRATELAPESATAHLGLGLALRIGKRFADAIAEYRRGLALTPRDVSGRLGLVEALLPEGRDEDVEAELARVLALDPGNGPAHKILCLGAVSAGAMAEARDQCDRALAGGATVDARLLAQLPRGHGGGAPIVTQPIRSSPSP
jgi:spermidine synthase